MTSTAEPASPVFAGSRDRLVRRLGEPAVLVCGIVNVTPDSFYDGGRYQDPARAVDHGHTLVAEGAEMLDVGGESTRPGSHPPSVAEEIARVVPVIDALARTTSVPISVDTSRPEVMREAVAAGAVMINDVRALRLRGALDAAAALKVPVCLMHMQGEPATMQIAPTYYDVVGEVHRFLVGRVERCLTAGVAASTSRRPGLRVRQNVGAQSCATGRAAVHCQPRLSGDGWTVTQGNARSDHRSGGHRPTGRLSSGRSGRGPAGCPDLARPRCRRHRRRNSRHTGRRHRPSSIHEISTADIASIITDISALPRVRRRYPKDVLTQHVMPASARQGSNGFLLGVDVHGLPTQEADERQTAVLGRATASDEGARGRGEDGNAGAGRDFRAGADRRPTVVPKGIAPQHVWLIVTLVIKSGSSRPLAWVCDDRLLGVATGALRTSWHSAANGQWKGSLQTTGCAPVR